MGSANPDRRRNHTEQRVLKTHITSPQTLRHFSGALLDTVSNSGGKETDTILTFCSLIPYEKMVSYVSTA